MYFIFYIFGSCKSGDRNAFISQFQTIEEAKQECKDIKEQHPDAHITVVEGSEINMNE